MQQYNQVEQAQREQMLAISERVERLRTAEEFLDSGCNPDDCEDCLYKKYLVKKSDSDDSDSSDQNEAI